MAALVSIAARAAWLKLGDAVVQVYLLAVDFRAPPAILIVPPPAAVGIFVSAVQLVAAHVQTLIPGPPVECLENVVGVLWCTP